MKTIETFPHEVQKHDPVFITLKDGTRLVATIWRPVGDGQYPAILEYLPYRRRDGTAARDALTHPYFAGHGYACVRVDMRGSGDSDGILEDEYLPQEQADAVEVINWLAAQDWCSGAVGMIGISWGGFNGLQVAALQPEPLKAIVSICSTDDRYADDIHYMGGCLLMDNPWWHTYMFSLNTTPPDPEVVGDAWRQMWRARLERGGFWAENWLTHQHRDGYWRHGSVCEDFSQIKAAVYAVGGWADGYSNAVFRLLEGLQSPRKGLVGPWAHKYPHFAKPGPAIGFLQECLRWWDHWLKGKTTGIMEEPMLRAYLQDPALPAVFNETRSGQWVSEDQWPNLEQSARRYYLNAHGLQQKAEYGSALPICSPQDTGTFGGRWCAFGLDPDGPGDQRGEDGGSLIFQTEVLQEQIDILGAPILSLNITSDKTVAMVAAVLGDVMPSGAVTKVTMGVLNLTHLDSHSDPTALIPGQQYQVRVKLNDCGHRFLPGHRVRIALSTAYWPMVWPMPEAATLQITSGASHLDLPVRTTKATDQTPKPLAAPEGAAPVNAQELAPPDFQSEVIRDLVSGVVTHRTTVDEGKVQYPDLNGWQVASTRRETYSIDPDDPLTCNFDVCWTEEYCRGDWCVQTRTQTWMRATETHFVLTGRLEAFFNGDEEYTRDFSYEISRDLV